MHSKRPQNRSTARLRAPWMDGMVEPFMSHHPPRTAPATATTKSTTPPPPVGSVIINTSCTDLPFMCTGPFNQFESNSSGMYHDASTPIAASHPSHPPSEPREVVSTPHDPPQLLADPQSLSSFSSPHPSDGNLEMNQVMQESTLWSSAMTNYEYSGPMSFISICSSAAINWVRERTGSSSFAEAAGELTIATTRVLKIGKRSSLPPIAEPDLETALEFTAAYFDEAIDAGLAVVHRPWFLQRLRAFHDGGMMDKDLSSYALRMAVFATGSQIKLSRTETFHEANDTGWRYFENALRVYTDILFYHTSVLGIQALVVMSYYCATISHPCLEYMLCNDAIRLSVSQGLHREPPASLNLSQDEITQRCCVFWAAYCLEKQIVHLSGRHSLVDDSDVSLKLPSHVPAGSTLNLKFVNHLIAIANLTSMVAKQLTCMRTLRQGREYIVSVVAKFDDKLEALRSTLEPIVSLKSTAHISQPPWGLSSKQALYLRFLFFNVTLSIHTPLSQPWIKDLPHKIPGPRVQEQVNKSCRAVVETCRAAIRTLTHIHFDVNTPVSVSFVTPLYSLINLFIMILRFPEEPTILSDLALLDVGTGHFAWIRVCTESKISLPFVKVLASHAQNFYSSYCDGQNPPPVQTSRSPPPSIQPAVESTLSASTAVAEVPRENQPREPKATLTEGLPTLSGSMTDPPSHPSLPETSQDPYLGGDLEFWSTFLPGLDDDDWMDFGNVAKNHLGQD